jgi:MFS family permease
VLLSRSIALPALYAMLAALPLFFISLQAVRLQSDLGFSESRLGLAIGIGFAASGIAATGAGDVVRRFGPSVGLRSSAALAAGSLAWLAVGATSWLGVAVSLSLGGIANVVAQMSMNLALVPDVPRERQALAFALKQASMPASSLLCGLLVPVLAAALGWRALALTTAVGLLVPVLLDPKLIASRASGGVSRRRPDRQLAAIAAAGLCAGAVAAGLPAFAVDAAAERGITAAAAGLMVAAGSLLALATRIVAGWAVDRHRGHGLSEFAAIIGAAGASFALLAVADVDALFALGIAAGVGASYGCAGVIHLATLRTSALAPGAATGVLLAAIALGNVVGPAGFGAFVEHTTYRAAWTAAAAVALLSAASALIAGHLARRTVPFATGEF